MEMPLSLLVTPLHISIRRNCKEDEKGEEKLIWSVMKETFIEHYSRVNVLCVQERRKGERKESERENVKKLGANISLSILKSAFPCPHARLWLDGSLKNSVS